jgi:hypothetical protein
VTAAGPIPVPSIRGFSSQNLDLPLGETGGNSGTIQSPLGLVPTELKSSEAGTMPCLTCVMGQGTAKLIVLPGGDTRHTHAWLPARGDARVSREWKEGVNSYKCIRGKPGPEHGQVVSQEQA